jgi:uncharacterized membrane protein
LRSSPKTSRVARYFNSYNFTGFIIGSLFVFLSFLPSLLPRGWVLQAVLSAVLFSLGYGIGVFLSLIIREFKPKEPNVSRKTLIKKIAFALAILFYFVSLALGAHWQKQVHHLVGQPSENVASALGTTVVFILMTILLILIARSVVSLCRWLKKRILRWIPIRLAKTLALALTVLIVVGLVNGVIFNGLIAIVNEAFSVKNGTTDKGVTKPTMGELSGSPQSVIAWDTLGRQGRKFVSNGQKEQRISEFSYAAHPNLFWVAVGPECGRSG